MNRNKRKSTNDYKFYDEKEWRYVPAIQSSDIQKYPKIIGKSDWNSTFSEKFKVKPHFLTENQYHLKFGFDDIEYLIVKNEKDVNKLIKLKSKIERFDDLLLTKIITMDKINRDF
ncbi:Abortive phage resistance protein AbiGi [Spirosomataceae bacterium]